MVPKGLENEWEGKRKFRLGATLPEAYATWSTRLGAKRDKPHTVGALLEQYALEVIPHKAPTTQAHNTSAIKPLLAEFKDAPLTAIKPSVAYGYLRHRGGTTGAKRELEVLSHALTKAVEWGYIDRHPLIGQMQTPQPKPRTRYVEDWEVEECLSLESKRKKGSVLAIQAYIRLKLLTGMARSDLLRLTHANLTDEGILIQRHKTAHTGSAKPTLYLWSTTLRAVVAEVVRVRPRPSQLLFCTIEGKPFIDERTGRAGAWDSAWRGFIGRVLKETKVKERFTEHDLRAKAASDAPTLAHAQAMLSHASPETTKRHYRRNVERVEVK
jgi:integrase